MCLLTTHIMDGITISTLSYTLTVFHLSYVEWNYNLNIKLYIDCLSSFLCRMELQSQH